MQEIPKEDEITEVQLPGTTDRPGVEFLFRLAVTRADGDFNFRLAGMLHQRHLDFSSSITASTAFYDWQSK